MRNGNAITQNGTGILPPYLSGIQASIRWSNVIPSNEIMVDFSIIFMNPPFFQGNHYYNFFCIIIGVFLKH